MAMVVFCRRTLAFLNQPLCSCLVLAWPGSVSGEGKQIRSNSSVVVRVSEQQRASPREGDWPFVFFHPTDLSRTISVHSAAKSTPPAQLPSLCRESATNNFKGREKHATMRYY